MASDPRLNAADERRVGLGEAARNRRYRSAGQGVVLPVGHHPGGHGEAVGEVVHRRHLVDGPDALAVPQAPYSESIADVASWLGPEANWRREPSDTRRSPL